MHRAHTQAIECAALRRLVRLLRCGIGDLRADGRLGSLSGGRNRDGAYPAVVTAAGQAAGEVMASGLELVADQTEQLEEDAARVLRGRGVEVLALAGGRLRGERVRGKRERELHERLDLTGVERAVEIAELDGAAEEQGC